MSETLIEALVSKYGPDARPKLAELKAAHGELIVKNDIVFRCPTRTEWRMFIDTVARDKHSKAVAIDSLALSCAVYPERALVNQMIDRKPGIPASVSNDLAKLAGQDEEEAPKL